MSRRRAVPAIAFTAVIIFAVTVFFGGCAKKAPAAAATADLRPAQAFAQAQFEKYMSANGIADYHVENTELSQRPTLPGHYVYIVKAEAPAGGKAGTVGFDFINRAGGFFLLHSGPQVDLSYLISK